jgi:hypothetical protein
VKEATHSHDYFMLENESLNLREFEYYANQFRKLLLGFLSYFVSKLNAVEGNVNEIAIE